MSLRAVQLLVVTAVILLSDVVVGKLNHFRSNLGRMNDEDPYKKQLVELQNYGNGFTTKRSHNSRDKRAASGPQASTPFILRDDHHHYANVRYSGDESDVSVCLSVLCPHIINNYNIIFSFVIK